MKKIASLSENRPNGVIAPRFGVGMEMLDRFSYEPDPAYDDVAAIGAKWVRIQSGWNRTEKTPGVYDFAWLDDIVDKLNERNLSPWMCLCYSNALYSDAVINGAKLSGGPPIHTPEAREAWRRYVGAVAAHYKGRVAFYEIWNEPDGIWCWKHGVNGFEYGHFALETARAIREVDPDAKIAGCSMCLGNAIWLAEVLSTGFGDYMDYLTFHCYSVDIDNTAQGFYRKIHAVLRQYGCRAEIIQGETGAASQPKTGGALSWLDWSEEKQAKFLLRLLLTNAQSGVKFTSWFMAITKYSKTHFRYGLIQQEVDEKTNECTYRKVLAYDVMRNLCSVFRGDFVPAELPVSFAPDSDVIMSPDSAAQIYPVRQASFTLADGHGAFVYWKSTPVDTTSFKGRINVQVAGLKERPKLIDLMSGDVFLIDEKDWAGDLMNTNSNNHGEVWMSLTPDMGERHGLWNLELPLYDYPMVLVF